MLTVSIAEDNKLRAINTQLNKAIEKKDKKQILSLYDEANKIDFDSVGVSAGETYDELVSKANDILYS